MRKFVFLVFFLMCSILVVYISEAGLLKPRKPSGGGAPEPRWRLQAPDATGAVERRYDINRDGILQTAETKIFLRDVIDVIEAKGGYTINSDILKEYDKNKDGVISKIELPEIKSHTSY